MARFKTLVHRFRTVLALIPVAAVLMPAVEVAAQQESDSTQATGILRRSLSSEGAAARGRGRGRGRGGGGGYSIYVPTTYDGSRALPLILALPSALSSNTAFMGRDEEVLPKLAEEHGYIIAIPGATRSRHGMWTNSEIPRYQAQARAEEESVLKVLSATKEEFKIDEERVYVLGHSSGGAAALFLASKHPELWAGVASIGGGWGDKETLASLKQIRVITVVGDGDFASSVARVRRLSEDLKSLGITQAHVEIEGVNGEGALAPGLPKVFEFFNQ